MLATPSLNRYATQVGIVCFAQRWVFRTVTVGVREMLRQEHSDRPGYLDDLAIRAADESLPLAERDLAMERLVVEIQAIAAKVARRFPPRMQADLISESGDLVWQRLKKFDPKRGRFENFSALVLRRAGIARLRKEDSGVVQPAKGGEDDTVAAGTEAVDLNADDDAVHTRVFRLRSQLDTVAWQPSSVRSINFFAVLLLQLRFALGHALASKAKTPDYTFSDALDLAEHCLRWHPEEAESSFKPQWPTLELIWRSLKQLAATSEKPILGVHVCEMTNSLRGGSGDFAVDVWHQWVKRAKELARDRLHDDIAWDDYFRPLLPDRPRAVSQNDT